MLRGKPKIGVTPDFNGPRKEFGGSEPTTFVRNRYLDAIWNAGGIPLILPLSEKNGEIRALLEQIDGILLTGSGPDIPPSLYREKQKYSFPVVDPLRLRFETELCRSALKRRLPLLGICGGAQLLNVVSGGSLLQDIPSELESPIAHRQTLPFDQSSHWITLAPESRLRRIVRKNKIRVNSSHHQAVKKPGNSLKINAVAPDGVIEGIERTEHPFAIGIQWHPEWMVRRDPVARRIFKALIEAAKRSRDENWQDTEKP